jgi:hypothetical protein
MLHCRTPTDVLVFLRDFHNRWHMGAGKSFVDLTLESKDHNTTWLVHARANKIFNNTCGKGVDSFAGRAWTFVPSSCNLFLSLT